MKRSCSVRIAIHGGGGGRHLYFINELNVCCDFVAMVTWSGGKRARYWMPVDRYPAQPLMQKVRGSCLCSTEGKRERESEILRHRERLSSCTFHIQQEDLYKFR